jgi:hypothetical protein
MARELTASDVQRRLAILDRLYVPETVEEGRARLVADEMEPRTFALLVARRLEELRALEELVRYLRPLRETLRVR